MGIYMQALAFKKLDSYLNNFLCFEKKQLYLLDKKKRYTCKIKHQNLLIIDRFRLESSLFRPFLEADRYYF